MNRMEPRRLFPELPPPQTASPGLLSAAWPVTALFKADRPKLFELGRTVATPGAIGAATPQELLAAYQAHAHGAWGACDPEDAAANEAALRSGGRIFSVYRLACGERLWIITEGTDDDGRRGSTCAMLPEEY